MAAVFTVPAVIQCAYKPNAPSDISLSSKSSSFEVVYGLASNKGGQLIAGRNDTDADADALAKLARKLGALVNLLPLHPGGAPGLAATSIPRIRAFRDRLASQGVEACVRRSRGLDIDAACGQLRVEVERKRRRERATAPKSE